MASAEMTFLLDAESVEGGLFDSATDFGEGKAGNLKMTHKQINTKTISLDPTELHTQDFEESSEEKGNSYLKEATFSLKY